MSDYLTSPEHLRYEYLDVVENIRHYSNMRFVIFSVFFAVMGAVLVVVFSGQTSSNVSLYAKVGGLLLTIVFWIYEERASEMFHHYRKVGIELESKLGYKQISSTPAARFPVLEAKYTTRLFFFLWSVFWVVVLINLP